MVGPFIFSSNKTRPHLLADIITMDTQKEAVLGRRVMANLATSISHEAFTQTVGKQPPVFT